MNKIRLKTDLLTPGMRLGEPVTNANGVTLMPSGIRLTPMFIARIRKWNIDCIDVYVDKRTEGIEGQSAAESEGGPHDAGERAGDDAPAPAAADSRSTADQLSNEQQDFARLVAVDVSRQFVNVKNDPLMMQLRAVVIKRLVQHGPNGYLNVMRRADEADPNGDAAEAGAEETSHGS